MLEIQESYANDIREIVLPANHSARMAKDTQKKPEILKRVNSAAVQLELPATIEEGDEKLPESDEPSKSESEESKQHSGVPCHVLFCPWFSVHAVLLR